MVKGVKAGTKDRARGTAKPRAKARGTKKAGATKKKPGAKKVAKKKIEKVDGGRYVLIDGRRWRATDPSIPEEERVWLVRRLMKARRDVGAALRAGDEEAESAARRRVQRAKVALGERGAKWWENDVKKTQGGKAAGKKTGSSR